MHNATGRHLCSRSSMKYHTHTFTMCVMGQSFFLHTMHNPSFPLQIARSETLYTRIVSFSHSLLPGMGESEYFIIRNGHVLTYS